MQELSPAWPQHYKQKPRVWPHSRGELEAGPMAEEAAQASPTHRPADQDKKGNSPVCGEEPAQSHNGGRTQKRGSSCVLLMFS